jgi:hypothetical protein
MRMTKPTSLLTLWLLLMASGSAMAQQQTFACSKLCWTPAKNSVTCSKKLRAQIELTSYIYAVQHNTIAKGKAMTFFVDKEGSGQSCNTSTTPGSLGVIGYLSAQNVTAFTIGGIKVGDTIEITAGGVDAGQKNILFFPDPSENR